MADNETETKAETKEKRTVPALERTARGVANHAAAVLEMQWDKERKSFKDPITAMMALFTYAKLTAALLDEAEARLAARETALEVRVEKIEAIIAEIETWKTEAERQAAAMAQEFESVTGSSPEEIMTKLREIGNKPATLSPTSTPPALAPPALPIVEGDVVQLKPEKAKREREQEKNGGAA